MRTALNKLFITAASGVMTVAASGVMTVAASGIALATATPALALAGSASTTIELLEAQGIDVRLSRIGSAPLEECEVTDIGKVQEQKQLINVDDDDRNVFVPVVVKRTVTVTLDCTRS